MVPCIPSKKRFLERLVGRRQLIDQAQLALRAVVQANAPVEVFAHHDPPKEKGNVFGMTPELNQHVFSQK